ALDDADQVVHVALAPAQVARDPRPRPALVPQQLAPHRQIARPREIDPNPLGLGHHLHRLAPGLPGETLAVAPFIPWPVIRGRPCRRSSESRRATGSPWWALPPPSTSGPCRREPPCSPASPRGANRPHRSTSSSCS